MDHIDEQRPGARQSTPCLFEIVIRLHQPDHRVDGHQSAELSGRDPFLGGDDDRVVATMMADKQADAGALAGSNEITSVVEGGCQWLFDEGGNAHRDTLQSLLDMELVGRRQDDTVWPVIVEQCSERRVASHSAGMRIVWRGGGWIDDRMEGGAC